MSPIRIYSIETPLRGRLGFAITAADLSNVQHFKAEIFIVFGEFFRAFSIKFDNGSFSNIGIELTEDGVMTESLQQVKNEFAEYLDSFEPGSHRAMILESTSIVPSEIGVLIQHGLHGGQKQLEEIRHKTTIEKLRGLIDPILDIHPIKRHEL